MSYRIQRIDVSRRDRRFAGRALSFTMKNSGRSPALKFPKQILLPEAADCLYTGVSALGGGGFVIALGVERRLPVVSVLVC